MKKFYLIFLFLVYGMLFPQTIISFEQEEGYVLGDIHQQNKWEVTQSSDGYIRNQIISDERVRQGIYSFKNAHEPDFNPQWFPIFGVSQTFEIPYNFRNFIISYDISPTGKGGADFEFTLFSVNGNDEFVPVAGVGIENRGYIYLIKNEDYGFDYAQSQWQPNEWTNVKIEVTQEEIRYYINNVLEKTIENYTQLNIFGFNMLHNNYGGSAYYDNIIIQDQNLETQTPKLESIKVVPIPAKDFFSIELPSNVMLRKVELFSANGQKILETTYGKVNLSQVASGIYYVKVTTVAGDIYTKKIIKK